MTQPDISPILEDLAAGRIDAAEASKRIDALRRVDPTPPPPPQESSAEWRDTSYDTYSRDQHSEEQDPPRRRRSPGTNGVDRIAVHAVGRRVTIVGDSSVAAASAEGPHVLRRNGSVLEVSSDGELGGAVDGGFSLLRAPRSLDDLRAMGLGKALVLRVNPSIVADVEVTAGSLDVENVPYLGKVRVTAGAVTLKDVAEVSDMLVQAGQASVSGRFTSGRSRVRVESGSLTVKVDPASSVVVRGESQLGKVSWTNATPDGDEVTLGDAAARLDVSVVMGLAEVKVDVDPAPAEATPDEA